MLHPVLCFPLLLFLFLQSCVQSEEYFAVPTSEMAPASFSSMAGASSSSVAEVQSSASMYLPSSNSAWGPVPSSSAGGGASSSWGGLSVSSSARQPASSSSTPDPTSSSAFSSSSVALPVQVEYNAQQCPYIENPGTAPRTGYLQCAEQIYNTALIGDRVWMTENLSYVPEQGNSWCYAGAGYDCIRLYDWAAAMGLPEVYLNQRAGIATQWQGLCPVGWHVSSEQDWVALARALGAPAPADGGFYSFSQGRDLVASSLLWAAGGGADPYGFSALPMGYYYSGLHYLNNGAFFWMANDYESITGSNALGAVVYEQSDATVGQLDAKKYGRSVRCVKDPD